MKFTKILLILSALIIPANCHSEDTVSKDELLQAKEEAKKSIEQAKDKLEYSEGVAEEMQDNAPEEREEVAETTKDELITEAKRNYEQEKKLANDMLQETKEKYSETNEK